MVIQYPGKLDKNRPVHVTLDHTSSKDQQIYNNIVGKMKAAGINVQPPIGRTNIGPNEYAEAYVALLNRGEKNAVLVGVVNGIDPTNIKEVGLQSWDNRGTRFRNLGNDVILAYFYDSCDAVHEDGRCYKRVRERNPQTDVPTGGYFAYPSKYAADNKIYMVAACSDEGTKPERADYTGDKIAQEIINLFGSGTSTNVDSPGTTDTTVVPTTTPTTTDTTNKVISTKTITNYYQIPFYAKVFKTATDHNGAFRTFPTLPYQGEYDVTLKFAGDRTHSGTTRSIKIKNYNSKSALGKEKLLRTVTVTKYTDGTSNTAESGTVPEGTHTKREVITETYTNGNKTGSSTKYIYSDSILVENPNADMETTIITGDGTTPTVINTGEVNNPFNTVINTNNGVPNVASMQADGKNFVMVDTTKTYNLTLAQYQKVYDRDSQTMQVTDYKLAKYVAFESTDTQTYNVVERGVWNFVTESIHQWLVRHNGHAWPSTYIIDFPNHRTKCGDDWVTWKGYEDNKYGVTGGKCGLYVVGDAQDTGYTCGPTSLSCCSQVLMHYNSESKLAKAAGTNGNGTGPDGIAKAAKNNGFKASVVYSNPKSVAVSELKKGHAFVWHISGHYMAFVLRSQYDGSVLVLNSSGGVRNRHYIGYGRLSTGWQPESNITMPYGGHVAVELNWTLTEDRKTLLTNFFNSMGGAWERPSSDETVRRYWSV